MTAIDQLWPWYVAGPLIALVMLSLVYLGKSFGLSQNLQTMCSLGGAARWSDYFKIDRSTRWWNLIFALGILAGATLAGELIGMPDALDLAPSTVESLESRGISATDGMMPEQIFGSPLVRSSESSYTFGNIMKSPLSLLFLIGGGMLIGFGTRYAGGCTSGHAIMGLSNLQWPSLLAVIGFFIGGLLVTHLVLPSLLPHLSGIAQ